MHAWWFDLASSKKMGHRLINGMYIADVYMLVSLEEKMGSPPAKNEPTLIFGSSLVEGCRFMQSRNLFCKKIGPQSTAQEAHILRWLRFLKGFLNELMKRFVIWSSEILQWKWTHIFEGLYVQTLRYCTNNTNTKLIFQMKWHCNRWEHH